MKKVNQFIPSLSDLLKPTLKALQLLGNSGSVSELNQKVYELLSLPDDIAERLSRDTPNLMDYRLSWARSYLKKAGYIDNSIRGVWSILPWITTEDIEKLNPRILQRRLYEVDNKSIEPKSVSLSEHTAWEPLPLAEEDGWQAVLYRTLIAMSPSGFENLIKRVLRELGFTQVEVTGKSGDGGIDGKGIVKISGVLSFYVLFQCKKYQKSISPTIIRDFRGAMTGRADKGLLVTTSSFTREAIREARCDGAPPIDLISGEELLALLKQLQLGVKTELIENNTVDTEFFKRME